MGHVFPATGAHSLDTSAEMSAIAVAVVPMV